MRKFNFIYLIALLSITLLRAQNVNIYPVTLNEKMPDISFADREGNPVNIDGKSGKKTMLLFSRGKVTPEAWCSICQYQYLELAAAEKQLGLRKNYNIDIYFIIPYATDSLNIWLAAFPQSLQVIENWKNPPKPDELTENGRLWMEYAREFFPESFKYSHDDFEFTIQVLFDPGQTVSKGLLLFREEWGGTKVAQNVPTIFIIGEDGKVKFKYHSQYTNDRPSSDYLVRYFKKMF